MTNPEAIIRMANSYRDQEPSDVHKEAYRQAVAHGGIEESLIAEMRDALYDPFPDRMKDTPVDPFEEDWRGDPGNGLATAVSTSPYHEGINLHVSEKLWRQQPIGVLLGPINDEVRKAGEAIVTDVTPRSADVESGIMPAEHYKLRIEPTPVVIASWVGENGYPTL